MNSETELPPRVAEEDARLEALLVEGLSGGENIPLTREFWTELKAEALQIASKHKQST
jgi:antitoxin ParD1/3/4